ncbi:uncharacterized protein TM35_000322110 [Trypanosoma theileri]|uniref:Uncharacterized protein n=1 Tax=Trypanosoma theileri TaxID=67003 RepID=A0A1X0NMF4_9TRYP|nr:uncharacterized protein TM35_000322110 [Trypanosoma theileri]ORC85896.1 hypothetical protein TM35_000322110 [Trypanosoma theileri]
MSTSPSPPATTTSSSYFDMLVNSDPRIAFDTLHFGVLCAVAEMEHDPRPQQLQSARKALITGDGPNARFVIPTHQTTLDARLPQPQDVDALEAYLDATSSHEALQHVLGPAVLHAVQKYRPQVTQAQRGRRRRQRQTPSHQQQQQQHSERDETATDAATAGVTTGTGTEAATEIHVQTEYDDEEDSDDVDSDDTDAGTEDEGDSDSDDDSDAGTEDDEDNDHDDEEEEY